MRNRQQPGDGDKDGSRAPRVQNSAAPPHDAIPFAQRLTCTVAEACEVTGLGRTKLYELIGERRIQTTAIGRRRLVLVRSLRALLDKDA